MGDGTDQRHAEGAKKAAGSHIESYLLPETGKAGAKADEETEAITESRGEWKDWALASGLGHRQKEWLRHRKQLEWRLQQERSGLLDANRMIENNDMLTQSRMNGMHGLVPPVGPDPSDNSLGPSTGGTSDDPSIGGPPFKSPISDFT